MNIFDSFVGKGLKFSLANLITSWRNKQADEIDLFFASDMPIQCFARCLFSKTSKIKPNLCKICEREDSDNDAMSKK